MSSLFVYFHVLFFFIICSVCVPVVGCLAVLGFVPLSPSEGHKYSREQQNKKKQNPVLTYHRHGHAINTQALGWEKLWIVGLKG